MEAEESRNPMIMLTLPEGDVRTLMNMLLVQTVFDDFDLRSCTIQSFARFDIEGSSPEPEHSRPPFCKWQRLRPYVYNIIKGSQRPRFLKFVFSLSEKNLGDFEGARALFVNIIFDKNMVHLTTGASMNSFSLDRSVEGLWDSFVVNFLRGQGLNVSEE